MYACDLKAAICVVGSVLVLTFYVVLRDSEIPGNVGTRRLNAAAELIVQVEHGQVSKNWNPVEYPELSCLAGIVTVETGGRLGNMLMEYTSAWSLSKQYGLRLAIPNNLMQPLGKVFYNLSAELLEDVVMEPPCGSYNLTASKVLSRVLNPKRIRPLSRYVPWAEEHKQPVILRTGIVLAADIAPVAHLLDEEFFYKSNTAEAAKRTLADIRNRMAQQNGTHESKVLVVGVHVRRTDYSAYLRNRHKAKNIADVGFYRRAAARMRELLRPEAEALAFVVASDDRRWCQENLLPELLKDFEAGPPASGAFMVPKKATSRDHDMALLSMADHSIFAYGTFGSWGALMAGGRAILFNLTAANPGVKPPPATSAMSFVPEMPLWEALV